MRLAKFFLRLAKSEMRFAFYPSASRIFIFLACKAFYALSDTNNFNQNPLKYLLSVSTESLKHYPATLKR